MSFYVTGGTLQSDARSYVEREADRQLYEGLLQGDFCYVLTARQMGKSSLMVRTANRLRAAGVDVVALDLTALGGQNITPQQWYFGLLDTLGQELDLCDELEAFWQDNEHVGPLHRFMKSIRQFVLPHLDRTGARSGPQAGADEPTPLVPRPAPVKRIDDENTRSISTKVRLVIFVDEIDFVRSLPFSTDEFFAAIREWYNHRTRDSTYEQVTFCLLGVASPSDLIRDTRTTPFNIGRRIELNDFTSIEAVALAQGLEDANRGYLHSKAALERILHWTKGHPYLTQRLCRVTAEALRTPAARTAALAESPSVLVDRLCADLFFSARARERDDNLIFVRERILRNDADLSSLLDLYLKIWQGKRVMDDEFDPLINLLRLSGVARVSHGRLRERNRIYARVFDDEWVRSNLPDAELRRQREAYFRGLVRATAVAAVAVVALATLVVLALWSRDQAKDATWTALLRQARLSRVSALAGQRIEALESLRQAARIRPSSELRDEAIACLALPDLKRRVVPLAPGKDAKALAFSDDLELYAFSNRAGEISVRGAADDREIARWRAETNGMDRICFSRDKRYLALGRVEGDVAVLSLWRCSSGEALFTVTNLMPLEAFDFSPDGSHIAMGGKNGLVRLLTMPRGEQQAEIAFEESCSALRFDPAGRRLAVASSGSLKIGIFDAASGVTSRMLHSASPIAHLAWHPDGLRLAAVGEDERIRIWDVETDEFAKEELPRQPSDITALAFSHSGDLLASACADHTLRLWHSGSGHLLLTVPDSGHVGQLTFSPDDLRLGFALSGDQIQLWDVFAGDECRTLYDTEAEELSALDVHPGGRLLATAHANGVTFWDLAKSRRLAGMSVGGTTAVRFHPASGDLIDGEFRGTYCFSVEAEGKAGEALILKPKKDFYLGTGTVAVDAAAKADVLAIAYDDRIRLARNTNSAYSVIGELIGKPGFRTVAVSPNGLQIAAGNWTTGDVWLWESTNWTTSGAGLWDRANLLKPRRLLAQGPARVRFSPDGCWLATGTAEAAMLWDTQSWDLAVRVERPRGASRPAPVAFAKSGLLWAVAWTDTSVRLLDVSGRTIADLEPPHKELLVDLAFNPDGPHLVCATSAGIVQVWNLDAVARGLAGLGLENDFPVPSGTVRTERALTLTIGEMDRLRYSRAKNLIQLHREIASLTELIRENPDQWYLFEERAKRLRGVGEYDSAVRDYHRWIELERASSQPKPAKSIAWPLRDLALVHLFGPRGVRDYEKAVVLTREAIEIEPENADNHFRYGIACYRLERYEEAANHLEVSRRLGKSKEDNVAAALFYEAMCQAHRKRPLFATQLLEEAKQAYARTDLKYREANSDELSELLWEAERVVRETRIGG